MSKVIMGIGLPGAGKTTALKPFAEKNSYTYICPDDIRAELLGDAGDQSKNRDVWEEAYTRTSDALTKGETVVLDATFANSFERKDFIRFVRECGAGGVHGVFADIPLEIADGRNRARGRVVPYGGMEEMNEMLKKAPPVIEDGFDSLRDIGEMQALDRATVNDRRIILASTSVRRKELLKKAGLVFEVVGSDYEEDMTLALPPSELAKHLSRGKAEAVAKNYPDAVVIGADTFITHGGVLLGKPHTSERAKEMLRLLSGKMHTVITGFTIIDTKSGTSVSEAVETNVYFKDLSDQEIDAYVSTGEALDRAGAYTIQGAGKSLVDHIEGDYDNVVGLPVSAVLEALKKFE